MNIRDEFQKLPPELRDVGNAIVDLVEQIGAPGNFESDPKNNRMWIFLPSKFIRLELRWQRAPQITLHLPSGSSLPKELKSQFAFPKGKASRYPITQSDQLPDALYWIRMAAVVAVTAELSRGMREIDRISDKFLAHLVAAGAAPKPSRPDKNNPREPKYWPKPKGFRFPLVANAVKVKPAKKRSGTDPSKPAKTGKVKPTK
jgi:hypothetical protein